MRDGLLTPASQVLTQLDAVRRSLLTTDAARMYMVGSTTLENAVRPQVKALEASPRGRQTPRLSPEIGPTGRRPPTGRVAARLIGRETTATPPTPRP